MTAQTLMPVSGGPLDYQPVIAPPGAQRVVSLDALRGFDMFWIVGGEGIVQTLDNLLTVRHVNWPVVRNAVHVAAIQLDHQPWEGFHAYDLIFPMFIFVVGASLVFSLSKLIATRGLGAAVRRVVIRGVILYAIGILYYGGPGDPAGFQHIRLMGVLQRIAIAYFFAGLLFCFFRPRVLLGVCVGLLVVYWAIMTFVPAPGVGHVSFAEGKNIANWIDAKYLPFRKWDGDHDPEGLLSTIPAVCTCLLGVFAGLLLKDGKTRPWQKSLLLLFGGAVLVGLGFLWGLQFPVIKKLWTSSFVLVAGGYSAALLGLFYLIIDVWKLRLWAAPFVWIGMNAITLYVLENVVNFRGLADRFVGGDFATRVMHVPLYPDANVAAAVLAVLLMLIVARFLYVRKIFLRV